MTAQSAPAEANRAAITVCVILATLMQSLDQTIANIALPHIQASVSASQDQVSWVLTSYLVAAAIMTPPTGFLAERFGIKRVLLTSVAGFVFASILCGLSQSLVEIVLFRILQGVFGAAVVPLSQAVLVEIYPAEQRGTAMGLWGLAVMVGPVLGPILGGWLTDSYSWRFVFYVNLPIGILAFVGLATFLPKIQSGGARAKLDWLGFGALSLAIGAFQILLDRGEQLDWFGSGEIIIEAIIACAMLYLFIVHILTTDKPFLPPPLLRNRNFLAGTLFNIVLGLTYFASLALLPTYLQTLMNYPIVTAGLVLGPQGLGSMASMMIAGRLVGRVDTRLLLGIGLSLAAWGFFEMTLWTPDISQVTIMAVGFVQGASIGFLFVPLSVVTLSTLPPELVADGAGFSTLMRNIASSSGIAVATAMLVRNTQINHAEIAKHVTAVNRMFEEPDIARSWDPATAAGRAALDAVVTQQAQIIAYIDDFKLLMIATLVALPLLAVFSKPADGSISDHAIGGMH
jgi:MFS transporter, DHA2 family, multidrug resistance protein